MSSFKDLDGREWKLRLTIGIAERITDELGIDILHPERVMQDGRTEIMAKLMDEPRNLFQILDYMTAGQHAGVDAQALKNAADGDTMRQATYAFMEALAVFFEGAGRPDRARLYRTVREVMAKTIKATDAKMQTLTSEIDWDAEIAAVMNGETRIDGN